MLLFVLERLVSSAVTHELQTAVIPTALQASEHFQVCVRPLLGVRRQPARDALPERPAGHPSRRVPERALRGAGLWEHAMRAIRR